MTSFACVATAFIHLAIGCSGTRDFFLLVVGVNMLSDGPSTIATSPARYLYSLLLLNACQSRRFRSSTLSTLTVRRVSRRRWRSCTGRFRNRFGVTSRRSDGNLPATVQFYSHPSRCFCCCRSKSLKVFEKRRLITTTKTRCRQKSDDSRRKKPARDDFEKTTTTSVMKVHLTLLEGKRMRKETSFFKSFFSSHV